MTALTNSSNPFNTGEDYQTHSDMDELTMANIAESAGMGQVLYDDQTNLDDLRDLINGGGNAALMGLLGGEKPKP